MTPSEELRAAARTLREVAAKATPGQWRAYYDRSFYSIETEHEAAVTTDLCKSDARWIALANPTLAEPLAAWLDACANEADDVWYEGFVNGYALSLARLITTEENTQ